MTDMLKKEKNGSIKNAADKAAGAYINEDELNALVRMIDNKVLAGAGHIDVCMHLDNAPNMPGCEGLKCTSCMIPNLNTEND